MITATWVSFLMPFDTVSLMRQMQMTYGKLLNLVKQRENELNIPENRMFYLSVGPEFFGPIALNIKESGLGSTKGWKRLIIEKPFGRDLKSARELNTNLSQAFEEDEIYRIDHYLRETNGSEFGGTRFCESNPTNIME